MNSALQSGQFLSGEGISVIDPSLVKSGNGLSDMGLTPMPPFDSCGPDAHSNGAGAQMPNRTPKHISSCYLQTPCPRSYRDLRQPAGLKRWIAGPENSPLTRPATLARYGAVVARVNGGQNGIKRRLTSQRRYEVQIRRGQELTFVRAGGCSSIEGPHPGREGPSAPSRNGSGLRIWDVFDRL